MISGHEMTCLCGQSVWVVDGEPIGLMQDGGLVDVCLKCGVPLEIEGLMRPPFDGKKYEQAKGKTTPALPEELKL